MQQRFLKKARAKVTKLDMARQIVTVLYNLPGLPEMETASHTIKRHINRLTRRTVAELEPEWKAAYKALQSRPR